MGKAFYNLDELRSIRILDVCEAFGVEVRSQGKNYFCKLRNERTASCKLYLDNNEYDSFYDFGAGVGGDVIKFVSVYANCDWQKAVEDLAAAFHIEPVNNIEYATRNELTDHEYKKIGVYGDLATKNFDINLEKYSLDSVQKYSEKYAMPVNQLRNDYPNKYVFDILKKRAIPFVYTMRNDYYFALHRQVSLQKALFGSFDINDVPEADLKEGEELCRKLIQAEKLLEKALRGTDVKYTLRYNEYDVRSDLDKVSRGEVSFEIGDMTYYDVMKESRLCGVGLRYREVSVSDYLDIRDYGLKSIAHAAFVKEDKVNLVFLPEHEKFIDKYIDSYNKEKGSDREAGEASKNVVSEKSSDDVKAPETWPER